MERVGVREFKSKASEYLRMGKPLAVTRHGELMGYYIPVKKRDPEAVRQRIERFEAALERFLAETGLTEDELAELVAKGE